MSDSKELRIEKLVRIISSTTDIILKKSDDWGIVFEDKRAVMLYNPQDLYNLSDESIIGCVLSHAALIKFNSFAGFDFFKKIKPYRSYPKQFKNLINIIES